MTLASNTANRTDTHNHGRQHTATTETKPAFKTTELIAYVVAVVDDAGRQGFGADHAWLYITILTVGYMISRGLAKAGSYEHDNDPRT